MNTLNFMCQMKHHMSEIIHKRTKNWDFFTLNLRSAWGQKGGDGSIIIGGNIHQPLGNLYNLRTIYPLLLSNLEQLQKFQK